MQVNRVVKQNSFLILYSYWFVIANLFFTPSIGIAATYNIAIGPSLNVLKENSVQKENDLKKESNGISILGFTKVSRTIEAEAGIAVYERFYGDKKNNSFTYEKANRVHIPLRLSYAALDALSLGVGMYFSYRMGSVKTVSKSDGAELQTSATDIGEFGFENMLAINIKINQFIKLRLEGVYTKPISENDTKKVDYYSFFLGTAFVVQN